MSDPNYTKIHQSTFLCNNKEYFIKCFDFFRKTLPFFKAKYCRCVIIWYKQFKKRKARNLPELLLAISSSGKKGER